MARRKKRRVIPKPITRGDGFGMRFHLGGGEYEWLGTFPTVEEAEQAWKDRKARGETVTRETWAQFCQRHPVDYNHIEDGKLRWGPETLQGNSYALKKFSAKFGHLPVAEPLPREEARLWARQQSTATIRPIASAVNDAVDSGLAPSNPFERLRKKKSPGRKNIQALTEEELHVLADCARASCGTFGDQFAAFLLFQGYQALRPIATAQIRPDDVRGDRVHVRRPGKNVEARTVLLFDEAAAALTSYPRALDANWLFTTPRGSKLTKTNLTHWWNKVRSTFEAKLDPRRQAELQAARPRGGMLELYELRHTGITLMLRKGLTAEQVAWQVGHTDGGELVRTLYSHPTDEDRFTAMRQAMSARDSFVQSDRASDFPDAREAI